MADVEAGSRMPLRAAHNRRELSGGPYLAECCHWLDLFELFQRFLRFGFLAWGGPVAQIAMLRKELVDEERWVSSSRFNAAFSATVRCGFQQSISSTTRVCLERFQASCR